MADKEGFVVWVANGLTDFGALPPPLYEQLDTVHALLVIIFSLLIYLF